MNKVYVFVRWKDIPFMNSRFTVHRRNDIKCSIDYIDINLFYEVKNGLINDKVNKPLITEMQLIKPRNGRI